MEPFFESSNSNAKDWLREKLPDGKYRITKPGIRCEPCSTKAGKPVYRSVRVQYAKFTNKLGVTKEEIEWINSHCNCWTCLIYKNGRVVLLPSKDYSRNQRLFDDLKEIPSSIEVYLK